MLGDVVVVAAVADAEGWVSVGGFIFSSGRTVGIGGTTIWEAGMIRTYFPKIIHMMQRLNISDCHT